MKEKWDETRKAKKSGEEKKKRKKWKLLCHIENQELSQNFSFRTCSNFKSKYCASGSEGHCCLFIYWQSGKNQDTYASKTKGKQQVCLWDCTDYYYLWDFDYVIWWSTLIIKKLLSFLFSLDSVCFCLFLWLSSKALNFLSNAPDQKLTFFLSFPVVFPKF